MSSLRLRLLLLIASALLALVVGLHGFDIFWCKLVVIHFGYPVIFIAFCCFVYSLYRVYLRYFIRPEFTRASILPGLLVAGCSIFLLMHEPIGFKIVMDEPVLLSTSRMMHFRKEVLAPYEANSYGGSFHVTRGYLDKRPYFQPFLISLLHSITGYRPENAFVLNILLTPLLLSLAYYFGKKLTNRRGGIITVLLLTSIPLLAQNATGGHFEILNLVMILGVMLLACLYLERPGPETLAALCFTGILLTQTRYESTFFALPVALVVLLGWMKKKEIILTWPVVFSPLLLILYPMHFRVTLDRKDSFQIVDKGHDTAFELDYFRDNLEAAGIYFFNFGQVLSNSLLVSFTGLVALGFFIRYLVTHRREIWEKDMPNLVLALFLGTVGLCFALVMCYHWGQLSDPVASRFSLPIMLIFALVTVFALARWPRAFLLSALALYGYVLLFHVCNLLVMGLGIKLVEAVLIYVVLTVITIYCIAKRKDLTGLFILVSIIFIIFMSGPIAANHRYLQTFYPATVVRMTVRFFKDHPEKDYLFLHSSPLFPISYGIASAGVYQALGSPAVIKKHLLHRTYSAIYLLQLINVDEETGKSTVMKKYDIGPNYELETVQELRLIPLRLARIVKIVGVNLPETHEQSGSDTEIDLGGNHTELDVSAPTASL